MTIVHNYTVVLLGREMMKQNRTDKKKAQTREKIFRAAKELFLEKGFHRATVEEIAEKADVAKGTFFNHFATKDAVLFYIGEQRMILLDNLLEKELIDTKDAREKIITWLEVFGRANEEDKEILSLVAREIFNMELAKMQPEKEMETQLKYKLGEIIKEGQLSGQFRRKFDPNEGADVFVGMYFFTLFQWLQGVLDHTLTETLLARAEIIFSGIGGRY